jgi:ubiquinone/menaquinone biosynthesis C-methylase UbiE
MTELNTKQQVREFYDRVGWAIEDDGLYQNAQYEDLRPVVSEYIHKCHLRVNRYLDLKGGLLLDAGSGPVQYPEYLTYSEGYQHRVCADISITALKEARRRLGDKGLYVVMDIANLPFKGDAFDGLVSLHTIHHLPAQDHKRAYAELFRVLKPGHKAVVVNGWSDPALMRPFYRLSPYVLRLAERMKNPASFFQWLGEKFKRSEKTVTPAPPQAAPAGTYVFKSNAPWLRNELKDIVPIDIFVWRTPGTRFTRTYIHGGLGRLFLRFIYQMEEWFPRFMGEQGHYPLISFRKD